MFDWNQVFGKRTEKRTDGLETKVSNLEKKLRKFESVKIRGRRDLRSNLIIDFRIGDAEKYSVVSTYREKNDSRATLRFPESYSLLEEYTVLLPDDFKIREGRLTSCKGLKGGGEVCVEIERSTCPHISIYVNNSLNSLNKVSKIVLTILEKWEKVDFDV